MAGSSKAVSTAKAAVGKGSAFSGLCEKFARTCFGFPARYASAKLAYQASARDGKITRSYNAPAGVPVFWDITYGTNAPYDHVAVSVGGGYCISTSAGPGRTVAKVKISDLTKRWGMRYLGWADHYHGKRVYTAPKKGSAPKQGTPTTRYPHGPSGILPENLKSSWYRLLGALGYPGDTWTRLQRFLAASGHYTGRIDGKFGPMSVSALQVRLREAHKSDPRTILDPGPADGVRGERTRKAEASYLDAHAWRAK